MKRFFTYAGLMALVYANAFAAPISPEEAFERFQDSGISITSLPATRTAVAPALKKTFMAKDGKPALYVFEKSDENGFLLLSADDSTTPLLGYSDNGMFDPENMAPGFVYWVEQYQRQIEYARDNGIATRADVNTRAIQLPSSWADIAPRVSTVWNQEAPFNNLCPKDPANNKNCYTGCVATAMAQAMKYFNYPAKGSGEISYSCQTIGQNLSLNLSSITFDWANMINSYNNLNYTSAQATAVAQLMQACGYAINMRYAATGNGSAAAGGSIPSVMVNYFNYDRGVRYFSRDNFTYTQWATMLYDNLKNVGPVIYDGQGSAGGHCWICDGYQNGYFHFNWGWGGLSDGYFLIDSLNPSALGAGGGGGNFNYDQAAVFNLQPNKNTGSATDQSEVVLYGNFTGVISGTNLKLVPKGGDMPGWGYHGLSPLTVVFGVAVVKADSPNDTPLYVKDVTGTGYTMTGAGYIPGNDSKYNVAVNIGSLKLEEGVKYKAIAAYQDPKGNWFQISPNVGSYNYFYITKTSSTKYTVENLDPLQFDATDVAITTDVYFQKPVEFTATLTNPNNTELTRYVSVALVNASGKVAFLGDSQMTSIAPGQSASITMPTALTKQAGISNVTKDTDFTLGLYDYYNGILFYTSNQKVTMKPNPGNAECKISAYVANSRTTTTESGLTYYFIDNARDFNVVTTANVTKGYFTDALKVGIFSQEPGTTSAYLSTSYPITSYTFMSAGQSKTWTTNIDLATATDSDLYFMGILNDSNKLLSSTKLEIVLQIEGVGDANAIESITMAEGEIIFLYDQVSRSLNVAGGRNGIASVEAYYLNGMKAPVNVELYGDNAFASLSGLAKGIVVITATDKSGNRKSTKIAL